jgi:CheY-like chemotaxis protein
MNRILVIDDEKDIRTALKQILELEGYEVDLAANGKDGLAKLEEHGADLVITDIIMPGIDGVATVGHIKKSRPNLPVIVISGGGNVAPASYEPGAISTSAFLASAQQAGAERTLTKPFERQEILGAIRELLP